MGFSVGDVVVRKTAGFSRAANGGKTPAGSIGTVCRIVTTGSMYRVRFANLPICVGVFEDSLRKAPQGTQGPICEDDC